MKTLLVARKVLECELQTGNNANRPDDNQRKQHENRYDNARL